MWWLTKQNNWVAGLMFVGVLALIAGIALWAYAGTGSVGAVVGVVLSGLVLTLLVFVVTPLVLGARYGITPAMRQPGSRPR
jgi:hypothetical protein